MDVAIKIICYKYLIFIFKKTIQKIIFPKYFKCTKSLELNSFTIALSYYINFNGRKTTIKLNLNKSRERKTDFYKEHSTIGKTDVSIQLVPVKVQVEFLKLDSFLIKQQRKLP